jgi:hypothetical protein
MPFYRKSSTMVPERDMEDQPAYSVTQIDGVASELMNDAGDRRSTLSIVCQEIEKVTVQSQLQT